MKHHRMFPFLAAVVLMCATVHGASIGTAFDFRGNMNESGSLAQGIYDFQFTLWDAMASGTNVAPTQTVTLVYVSNGLFSVSLDFGTNAFTGQSRYVQIAVRSNGVPAYTTLYPRQPIPLAPYALYAVTAGNFSAAPWTISSGTVTDSEAAVHSNILTFATEEGWRVAVAPDGEFVTRGNIVASGSITTEGDASIQSNLWVGGSASLESGVVIKVHAQIEGGLSAASNVTFSANADVNGHLWVGSYVSITDYLSVGGVLYANGGLQVNGNASVSGCINGSFCAPSDRNLKNHFQPVDGRAVLARLVGMPIQTWSYKKEDAAIRHIGPMAQDFAGAFGVGYDDKRISTVDADGVALAAIQGLNEIVDEKDARIRALEEEVAELKESVNALFQKANGVAQ